MMSKSDLRTPLRRRAPLVAVFLILMASVAPAAFAQQGDASVTFTEEASGGHAVVVASATLPEGGFMAIHDSTLLTQEDPLGSVIGVSEFLSAGTHENITVFLERPLQGENETLVAMPHKDTNGNRLYEFVSSGGTVDGPYTGGPDAVDTFAGPIVLASSTTNVSAEVRATQQLSSGTSILVDFVDLSEGGFVAVHDNTLVTQEDPIGSVVGHSEFLEAGIHRDVFIRLDEAVTSGPLIPMAHKDSNGNREYDFVTSGGTADPPTGGDVPTFAGNLAIAIVPIELADHATVTFGPQSTGGNVVVVPQTFLPQGGFVAIHNSSLVTEEDAIGSVIGVSDHLAPGLHRNVTVRLVSFAGESDTLVAMPHKDTNNNSRYEFVSSGGQLDGPYAGGPTATDTFAGAIVIESATVNKTARALYLPSVVQDNQVTVRLADFSEPGFLALHDASLLAGNTLESVIGHSSLLQAGVHENVTIPLKGSLNATTMLIVMPHKDSNGNGEYDFVTSGGTQDPPFFGGTGPNGISVSAAPAVKAASAQLPQIFTTVAMDAEAQFPQQQVQEEPTEPTPTEPTPTEPAPTDEPATEPTPTEGEDTTATPSPAPDTGTPVGDEPAQEQEVEDENDTPAPALAALLAVLVGVALVLRRRTR